MHLTGKIKLIGEIQTVGSSDFKKRELVITTEEQYPQDVLIEFVQDKCSLLDKYSTGQKVTVNINVRGREWINPQGEAKYFNSLQGWKIEGDVNDIPVNQAQEVPPVDESDGLPF